MKNYFLITLIISFCFFICNTNSQAEENKSDLEKIFQSIIKAPNSENGIKQILNLVIIDITNKFEEIIPSIKDMTNIKKLTKLDQFKTELNDLKKNFSVEKLSKLKITIEEFIEENNEFITYEESSSEKKILENFKHFNFSLNQIINDLNKFNTASFNGINLSDNPEKKDVKNSGLPKECSPECKCCKDNFCVPIEMCEVSKTSLNKNEEQEYFSFLFSWPFWVFISFIAGIILIYFLRKKNYFRKNLNNNDSTYNVYQNDNDISQNRIEMS